ncbi:MAG: type II secretion system F family protein [Cellulosilyticaceae bacterium]
MPIYVYKAKNLLQNKVIKGEGDFTSEKAVIQHLTSNHLIPIDIKEKKLMTTNLEDLEIFKQPVKLTDISFFCKQFAVMVEAGISIGAAIEICAKQSTNKTLKKHLNNVNQSIKRGVILSEAMRAENIFPELLISMVESGEVSGNLDKILNKMSGYFGRQLGIQRKIRKALMFPTITVIVLIVAVAIIMVKVIPGFVGIFQETGVQLPAITKLMINVSHFFTNYWMFILLGIALIIVGIKAAKKTEKGRAIFDEFHLKIPAVSRVIRQTITASFSDTTALLTTSGVPILKSMEVVAKVVNNTIANKEIIKAIENLRHGATLKESLEGSRIYPELMLNMIEIGEQTGELDVLLNKTAEYFQEEAELAIDQMMTLIEPILTILIAIIVAMVVLAVILPTFTLAAELM